MQKVFKHRSQCKPPTSQRIIYHTDHYRHGNYLSLSNIQSITMTSTPSLFRKILADPFDKLLSHLMANSDHTDSFLQLTCAPPDIPQSPIDHNNILTHPLPG